MLLLKTEILANKKQLILKNNMTKKVEKDSFITVGVGTDKERKLKIINGLVAKFTDDRLIQVEEVEGGSYTITVSNPLDSIRSNQSMWLSKDSFLAVIYTALLYCECGELNIEKRIQECTDDNTVLYNTFGDLKPLKFEKK